MKSPLVSIVIINKNDRGIAATLSALSNMQYENKEIIVVDASDGKLNDIQKDYSKIEWVEFSNVNRNKKHTIPEQRNVGVKLSKGKIIVFTDASCVPEKGWLENLIRPINEEGECIVAGATFSQGTKTLHDNASMNASKYVGECPTINLAFTRKLYDEMNGFDESFDYGSDVDFSWRIIDAGYKIRFEPSAIIKHDWGGAKLELKRSFRYGKARARLHIKHKKIQHLITHDIITVIYPAYVLGLPITIWWHWYPLLILIPAIKNFNKNPLRTIIDHLVFGVGVLDELSEHIVRKIL